MDIYIYIYIYAVMKIMCATCLNQKKLCGNSCSCTSVDRVHNVHKYMGLNKVF